MPLEARSAGAWSAGIPGCGQEAHRGEPDSRTGAQDRSTDPGDRFFKASLAACRGGAPAAGTEWRRSIYEKIEEEVKAGKELPINGMCQSAGVSRAGYYRFQLEPGIGDADMGWRDEIQKIAVEW